MKHFVLLNLLLVFLTLACSALAQDDPLLVTKPTTPQAFGEVISEAQCFNVINKAPYTVFGSIHTNFFLRDDGIKTRHKSNFRFAAEERAEFCTYGPFYDDQKVELVLKTLIPIFKCKTRTEGDIIIYGRRKSEGGTETWATCL